MNERSYRSYRWVIILNASVQLKNRSTALCFLFVEFRIELDRSSLLQVFPGSLIDRDCSLFFVSNCTGEFLGCHSCIYGDDCRMLLHFGNLKRFEGLLIESGIVDVGRGSWQAGGRPFRLIRALDLFQFTFYSLMACRSLFFAEISFVSVVQRERSIFYLVPGPE